MSKELEQAIDYFKNRNTFEVPVYDKPQFKVILKELKRLESIESVDFRRFNNDVFYAVSNIKTYMLGIGFPISNFESIENFVKLQQVKIEQQEKELEWLKKPPTEEEVCKALEEHFGNKGIFMQGVFYYKVTLNNNAFVYDNGFVLCGINCDNEVYFNEEMPINLATMICKFFEGRKE